MLEVHQVLFVDDEAPVRQSAKQWLELYDFSVTPCASTARALEQIHLDFPGIIVSDVRMPEMDGLAFLRELQASFPEVPVVLLTGHGEIAMAVEAMKSGAFDFIEKPYDPDRLLESVRRGCRQRRLVLENEALRRKLTDRNRIEARLIGNSPLMERLRQQVLDLAETQANVLIHGETGTGKELVARCLHDFSRRTRNPFVPINCAAVPENLFESELFGHESGAFTGAAKPRVGRIEYADHGTVFLDEIESMPLNLQVKVLRTLQEREVQRIGTNQAKPVDIRIVAATKRDLAEASEAGEFREDLYYRLNVAEVHLPPLRERSEDLPLLFEYFVNEAQKAHGRTARHLRSEELLTLEQHLWPGNVRELKNTAERFVLAGGGVGLEELLRRKSSTAEPIRPLSLAEAVAGFEKRSIEQSLRRNRGNIKQVLEELDLPRRTLNQKMQNYRIVREDFL